MSDLYAAFLAFHAANPEVESELVELARKAKQAGAPRYGIGALFEVLRWSRLMQRRPGDEFKLNNNHRAFYARKLMQEHPDLAGFFELREQVSSRDVAA